MITETKYIEGVLLTGENIKSLGYVTLGIIEELGEITGKVKRFYRGDYTKEQFRDQVKKESGDLLWYLTLYCHLTKSRVKFTTPKNTTIKKSLLKLYKMQNYLIGESSKEFKGRVASNMIGRVSDLVWCFGYTIQDIAQANIDKTHRRLFTSNIKGEGDER